MMLFGNQTAAEYINSLDAEKLGSWIRTLALVLSFLLVAFRDRKVWLTTDLIAMVGFGTAYLICPETILRFQVEGDLDSQLLSVSRLFGAAVLTSGVIAWRTRETRDGTVYITIMLSRVFCCSLMLISIIHTHFCAPAIKPYLNTEHAYFNVLGGSLWLLGNVLHLLWSHDFSTYPQHNIPLNAHLRVDAWFMLVGSITLLMYPEFLIKFTTRYFTGKAIHLHVVRGVALFGFSSGIISLQGPGFLHERDKKSQLINRMVAVVVLGLTVAFNHYWYNVYVVKEMLWLLGGAGVIFINAFVGCYFDRPIAYEKYAKMD